MLKSNKQVRGESFKEKNMLFILIYIYKRYRVSENEPSNFKWISEFVDF